MEDYLYHYGVRHARKDAKEYARAKMFYGEGAGNRRKLINAKVKERSKDPVYKKAFDEEMTKQDMAKHSTKAVRERHRKDVSNSVKKNTRGIINIMKGHPERVGASLAVVASAYALGRRFGIDKLIARGTKRAYYSIKMIFTLDEESKLLMIS